MKTHIKIILNYRILIFLNIITIVVNKQLVPTSFLTNVICATKVSIPDLGCFNI